MTGAPAHLLAATAAHAAFQAVVTAVVYPALLEVPPDRWEAAHERHSRRTVRVVAPLYGLLLASCAATVVRRPRRPLALVAVAATGGALTTTALVAAPTHAALGRHGPRPALVARLRRWDRVRLACALLGVTAAGADRVIRRRDVQVRGRAWSAGPPTRHAGAEGPR
ncbi:hypothetical protein [Cellulomonas endophytica]|uniref:hypothetical protein n=1 Tax=Cellulomonas endophytica TaxID=2494735 RepID=UPI00196A9B43|nr:hypothetical protein [Cellulomonas endophytica]